MGRAGFVSGQLYAQNAQSGSVVKTLSGTGFDTTSVVFRKVFNDVPKIVISQVAGNNDTTSVPTVTKVVVDNKTLVGFSVNLVSNTTGVVYYDYIAYDDRYN